MLVGSRCLYMTGFAWIMSKIFCQYPNQKKVNKLKVFLYTRESIV